MPISVSQMIANEASVTFPWLGESVTISYYPGKLSDAVINQVDEGLAPRNEVLASLVKSWDVLEPERVFAGPDDTVGTPTDNMVMFPLDAARLVELDFAFKYEACIQMIRNVRPNRQATQTPNS